MGHTRKFKTGGGDVLLRGYNVEGYSTGDYLPAVVGDSICLSISVMGGIDDLHEINIAIDVETAIALGKSLIEVGVSLGASVD